MGQPTNGSFDEPPRRDWRRGGSLALCSLLLCGLTLALAGGAQASKLCCSVFPPEPPPSEGIMGEQFGPIPSPGNGVPIRGIAGLAVNVEGNGPGVTPGDIYVVDKGNNRVQQLHELADGGGHRFVRAFGLDVGGAGVNVCIVASTCQAGTASAAAGGMSEPIGVAVDQTTGNLYVSDNVNHRIDVFRADGVFEGAFGWKVDASAPLEELQFCTAVTACQAGSIGGGAGQFGGRGNTKELNEIGEQRAIGHPAVAPAGAPDAGNVLIADSTNNRADEFAVTLNGSEEVSGVSFVRGIGWGVDTGAGALETCTTASTCQAGLPGGGLGQFTKWGLTRVAVDSTGAIYALNNPDESFNCNPTTLHCHVQKFNPAATAATEFAPTQLNRTSLQTIRVAATDIAVDPVSNDVYVARPNDTGGTAKYQILRFDSAGNLLETYPPTGAIGVQQSTAFGLAFDHASGKIYLSSTTGGQRIFLLTDPPPIPPTITTGAASPGANFSLMALAGTVNPEGFRVLGCRFEYGKTIAYGASTPCVPNELGEGTADVAVGAETEPLEPQTTYHYRLAAENGGPLGLGEDRTFTTGPVPLDDCPNAERRAEQGIVALVLPDCMALEMVSPPQKGGQPARFPEVSADGSRVKFYVQAALGEDPPGLIGLFGSTYVASRGGSGWETESTVPAQGMFKLWESENNPSFTPDLSRWLGIGATWAQSQQGISQAFEGGLGGLFTSLSQPLVPLTLGNPAFLVVTGSKLQGASADHSHLYFTPGGGGPPSYLPGDPGLTGPGAESADVYLARVGAGGQPAFELLNRDRTGKVWGGNCGARLGGIGTDNGERNQGAVSPDGSRTYLSARAAQPASGACSEANKLRILERLESESGPQIGPLLTSECNRAPAEPCSSADGNDLYQGASADGSKVYFTTNRQLADTDRDGSSAECNSVTAVAGCDLYLYDRSRPAGERLVQVSAGEELGPGIHEKGKEAKVYNGITGISGDGSHVYFVAQGMLTDQPNPVGAIAQPNQPNLYLWDAETEATAFLGTLSQTADRITLWGEQGTWRNDAYPVPATHKDGEGAEVGGDGHVLLFESNAELTSADADGAHLDLYRYDSDAEPPSLECISCRPGGPDSAPVDVGFHVQSNPGGTDFAEEGRWVSENGETAGFLTPEALVPGDINGVDDLYLWRGGELVRLPGRPLKVSGKAGPYLSHDGSVIAYPTPTALLPQDGDTAADIYVARVDGGYPNPPPPPGCEPGNGCQQSQAPPASPRASSEAPSAGNPKPRSCPEGKVRRNGRCVARHTRKKHAKKRHRNRHANADRRAAR
jgi:DNA-binding beta-propeller fold protein YncE